MGLKKNWKALTSIIISTTPDSTKKRGKNVQGDNNKQSTYTDTSYLSQCSQWKKLRNKQHTSSDAFIGENMIVIVNV